MNSCFYRVFIYFFIFLFALRLSAQESRNFSWLHPKPQGQSVRNIFTLDKDKWYGVTLAGDFIRTTDGGNSWQITENIGGANLFSGDATALYDVHMLEEKVGLVCGENGLLARTTDAGISWHIFFQPDEISGTWFDLFFIDNETGFVCGEAQNGIKITTNGGKNWSGINSPEADAFSLYAFDEYNFGISSREGFVLFTTNAGQSWDKFYTGSPDTLWKINFYNKATAIVCGTSSTVKITTDRGASWRPFGTNLPENTWYDIDFQLDESIIPVSESFSTETFPPPNWSRLNFAGSSMWERSTVSAYLSPACAWSNFDPNGGDNVLVTPDVEVTAGDKLTFYLRRSYTGTIFNWDSLEVLITSTGGNTTRNWEPLLRLGLNIKDTSLSNYPPRIGTYKQYTLPLDKYVGNIVKVIFRHKNHDGTGVRLDEVLVGTYRSKKLNRVYLTGNQVNIYRNTIEPLVYAEQPWIPLPFINPVQAYKGAMLSTAVIGEDSLIVSGVNGILNSSFSSSGNQSYSDRTTGNNLYDIWSDSDGRKILSVGSSGVVLFSKNEGASWSYNQISEGSLNSISMINDNEGWIAGSSGFLYKTVDGGLSWSKTVNHKAINIVFSDFLEVFFVDEKTGWAFDAKSNIIKTTNGGVTWKKQTSDITEGTSIFDSYMIDNNTGYFAGALGTIGKTTNGGETWFMLNTNHTDADLRSIFMYDSQNGWICGEGGILLKTSDGGNSWEKVILPYPNTDLFCVRFIDENNGMVAGSSGKTFRTTDGGATWEFENSGATHHYAIQMLSSESAYISSSTGNIVKYSGVQNRGKNKLSENTEPDDFTLYQNYPNPFNPSTTVKFQLPVQSIVSLKVYDVSGREIAALFNNEPLNLGTYSKPFYAKHLSSGIYFYSLIINGKIHSTRKMLLIK